MPKSNKVKDLERITGGEVCPWFEHIYTKPRQGDKAKAALITFPNAPRAWTREKPAEIVTKVHTVFIRDLACFSVIGLFSDCQFFELSGAARFGG